MRQAHLTLTPTIMNAKNYDALQGTYKQDDRRRHKR